MVKLMPMHKLHYKQICDAKQSKAMESFRGQLGIKVK